MLTWIEIHKDNLIDNLKFGQEKVGKRKIIPVVKANAYGLGAEAVIPVLQPYADLMAVVSTGEALAYKNRYPKIDFLVLTIVDPADIEDSIKQSIHLPIYNDQSFQLIRQAAEKLGRQVKVQLKIDTGLHRIGFPPQAADQILTMINLNPLLNLTGIFSHYAYPDNYQVSHRQTLIFDRFISRHKDLIPNNCLIHMSASVACLLGHQPKTTNAVRLGILIYGYPPVSDSKKQGLKPVFSFKTKVVHLQDLPAGMALGYDYTYTTQKPTRLAVLPVGYSDGYLRSLSNKARVLIGGQPCPIRGLVFMNAVLVDVSQLKQVKVGDQAVLIGRQGKEKIEVAELTKLAKVSNYEVMTALNPMIKRITT